MLYSEPTKKGTGVSIWGHADDLESLHETIHFLCRESYGKSEQHEHALSVAYELRKAFEQQRESRVVADDGSKIYGTKFVWPSILFYCSYFRQLAALCPTNKLHQSNLYLFEHCIESALMEYDPNIGAEILSRFSAVGHVSQNFLASYVEDVAYRYLYEGGSGKIRFRRLPQLMHGMAEWSEDYREYEQYLQDQAKKLGCSVRELRDMREWPEIQW